MLNFVRGLSESNGDMPKCWNKEHTVLYKCSIPVIPRYYEIDSEWLCCRFAEKLGIDCVKYDLQTVDAMYLGKQQKLITIKCHKFYGEQETFITPLDLMQNCSIKEAVLKIAVVDRKRFTQMVLFDFLIANDDRHLRNYGVIKDVAGMRFAPLFDNDKALFSHDVDNSQFFGTFNQWQRSKVGLYSMLYDGVVSELKLYKNAKVLLDLDAYRKNIKQIVYALPTDMTVARRENIIQQLNIRLQVLEDLML